MMPVVVQVRVVQDANHQAMSVLETSAPGQARGVAGAARVKVG
jgi:hypothetical protein